MYSSSCSRLCALCCHLSCSSTVLLTECFNEGRSSLFGTPLQFIMQCFLTVCTVMLVLLDNKLIKSSLVLFSCCSYLEQVTSFMGTDPMLAPLDLWIQGTDPLTSIFKQMFYRNTIYLNFFKARVWIIAY